MPGKSAAAFVELEGDDFNEVWIASDIVPTIGAEKDGPAFDAPPTRLDNIRRSNAGAEAVGFWTAGMVDVELAPAYSTNIGSAFAADILDERRIHVRIGSSFGNLASLRDRHLCSWRYPVSALSNRRVSGARREGAMSVYQSMHLLQEPYELFIN